MKCAMSFADQSVYYVRTMDDTVETALVVLSILYLFGLLFNLFCLYKTCTFSLPNNHR